MISFKNLSISDTTFFKGLAIIMIVLHNFFHFVKPSPGENEVIFNNEFIWKYFSIIQENYFEFIQATFSYLGHYGVQMFLFLSAYGLTKRYIGKDIKFFSYLYTRSKKVYLPFLISIFIWFCYVLVAGFTWGEELSFIQIINQNLTSLLYKVTLISNFIPDELYSINGPWWFISLIIQFYIVFPLLLNISSHEKGNAFLLMIAIFSILISMLLNGKLPFYIYGTFIGHLPEFILGIYLARKSEFSFSFPIIISSIILFALGNFYSFFWYFTDISVTVLLILLFQFIRKHSRGLLERGILYIGTVSMFMFLINGFLRKPVNLLAGEINLWYVTLLIGFFWFALIVSLSGLLDKYYNLIGNKK